MLVTMKTLVAEINAPTMVGELTEAQQADPIKRKRERLVTSMRAQVTDLVEAIERLPVTSLIRIQALEGECVELMSAWILSEELMRKLQEMEIGSYDELTNAQDDLDTEFTRPLEKARKDIIAK